MPARVSAWAVYDVFDVQNDEKVFVGVVSDGQWKAFCEAFDLKDWAEDEILAANNERVARRDQIIPRLRELFMTYTKQELMEKLETVGLPFAPIQKPEDLFTDPHLVESGGLLDMTIPDGGEIALPAMPVSIDGDRPGLNLNPPEIGEHTGEILSRLGLSLGEIEDLKARKLIDQPTSEDHIQAAE